ncbi:hypothetical protein RHGRI_017371 [Rhododendron griersonianum]|uniref:Myb/SANT-like domain-containing protein n=1 Tax=Rhododendron griersonianum TaxID=479676 RepID=A0AAV6JXK3_9ERIC|nr:hypothetical protein RHGRI_017371 [Rhododendron griersonianum]
MWSYANEEIFLKILLEEANKEQSVNTRKTRTFNQHQWTSIHKEFTRQVPRVGLGWDAEFQIVTAPDGVLDEIIKANSKNEKLRNKGIDHFELLDELLHNSMAIGAIAQPSTLGATTSEEERAMFGPPKFIQGGDTWYYEALTINCQQSGTPQFTMDDIQGIVGDTQYWKTYGLMMGPEGPSWREGFMQLKLHNRIGWVSQLD